MQRYALVFFSLFLAPTVVLAQQRTENVQPVFRFPLEDDYRSLCTQGNHDAFSHDLPDTEFGFDFDAPNEGDPDDPKRVIAAADGVAFVYDGCSSGTPEDFDCGDRFGNHVKISHGPNLYSIYGHMADIAIVDSPSGSPVRAGQVLGTEGNTGSVPTASEGKGDHLHFGVIRGDPSVLEVGRSIELQDMIVVDYGPSRSPTSPSETILDGEPPVCGILEVDGIDGHLYGGGDSRRCDTYDSDQGIQQGYGAAYDVLDSGHEVLLRATCVPSRTQIAVGDNDLFTYVWHRAYEWSGSAWRPLSLQCVGEEVEQWCIGEGIGNIAVGTEFFVAYVCQWTGRVWKCGCRDEGCEEEPSWSLQFVDRRSS